MPKLTQKPGRRGVAKSRRRPGAARAGVDLPRSIPSVEQVVQALGVLDIPRRLVVNLVRSVVARVRAEGGIASFGEVLSRAQGVVHAVERSRLRPVVNATGVVIHTNLGRAPLGDAMVAAIARVAAGYSNLEFDLVSGKRGDRGEYASQCLATLCDAEAALVVNNCAAGLVLALHRLCSGERREVILSRGELVQIGGGFRIPEILEASGARLREVGTTNRTTPADYEKAVGPGTAMILKVHQSNFYMDGFVATASTAELGRLARRRRVPLVVDLGTGSMVEAGVPLEGGEEPTPSALVKAGADLVCFSGDKLFGGPQCGVVVGRKRWVAGLKLDPLYRALRCDKLRLAALGVACEAWLQPHRGKMDGEPVPLRALLAVEQEELRARAVKVIEAVVAGVPALAGSLRVVETTARVGGGTLPRVALPSVAVEVRHPGKAGDDVVVSLRSRALPVIGLLHGGRVRLDLRAVFPREDTVLAEALVDALR